MEKLILPINKARLNASMAPNANDPYTIRFGFKHYGVDFKSTSGETYLFGLGNGEVAVAGWDGACGWVTAIVYPQALNHRTGEIHDVTVRYFHQSSVLVRAGQKVDVNTLLGYYGYTGKYAGTGPHLHVEVDKDTKYVLYTPTVKSSNLLRGTSQGAYLYTDPRNTVVNPIDYFHRKISSPENQTYTTANDAYIRDNDKSIPIV